VGLRIDGLGLDRTKEDGTVFYWGNNAPTAGDHEWIAALVKPPRGGWSRVNIVRNEITSNAVSFELELSDQVAEALQYTPGLPATRLSADLDIGDTSAEFDADPGSYRVVHINNEAISLGLGGTSKTILKRGYYSTTAQKHRAGDGVYLSVPHWKFRPVTIVVHDLETGAESTPYRGMIVGMPAPNLATIRIETRDILGPIKAVRSNENAGNANGYMANIQRNIVFATHPSYGGSRILAPSGATLNTAFQIAGAVVWSKVYESGSMRLVGGRELRGETGATYQSIRLGSRVNREDLEDTGAVVNFEDPVWELLVIDRAGDQVNPTTKISSTQDLDEPYHPLAVALALVRSDGSYDPTNYKIFSAEVGCGLTYVDTSAWATEIANTPELNTMIDQLVLGWDGSSFRAFDVATRLIRAAGYIWSLTESGGLSVRRFEVLSIETVGEGFANAVTPYRGSFPWKPNLGETASELFAVVGELPWLEGDRVRINVPGESKRSARFESRRFDYDVDMISRRRSPTVQNVLASTARVLHQNVPTLGLRVAWSEISGVDYDLGATISLDDIPVESGWIVDANGTRILPAQSENDEAWIGTIIGRSDDYKNMSVELEVALYGFADGGAYARLRAPSMRIQSYSGADLTGYASSDYGAAATDAETFAVGDDVSLFYLDCSPVSEETREITGISTDGSGNGVLTLASAFTATPTASMLVRPCESGNFANDALYEFTPRPYCYYADENDQVSGGGGDPFGGGLGVI